MKQCFITDRHPYEVHAEKQINKYFHFTLICFKPETVQCRRIKQQYKGDKKIGKSVNNIHSENHQTANRCKQSRIQKKTFVKRKLSESFGQFYFFARITLFDYHCNTAQNECRCYRQKHIDAVDIKMTDTFYFFRQIAIVVNTEDLQKNIQNLLIKNKNYYSKTFSGRRG